MPSFADDLRQMMEEWDAATPAQREEALAKARAAASLAEQNPPRHALILEHARQHERMKAGDFVFYNDGKDKTSTPVRLVWVSRQLEQVHALFPSMETKSVSIHMVHPMPRYMSGNLPAAPSSK